MAKTRGRLSKRSEEAKIENTPASSKQKSQLSTEVTNPPQLFILPENLSTEARILQLENPRHSTDSSYIVCPERGIFELTKVATTRTTPRSWLLSSESKNSSKLEKVSSPSDSTKNDEKADKFSDDGYVLRNANLMVATPIDPLFFLLPALDSKAASKDSDKQTKLFLSAEDYLERLSAASSDINPLLRVESLRASLEGRMASVCDTVEAGDEMMYRLSENKMLTELLKKARKMAKQGLTPSMEEKFVKKALEVPTLTIAAEDIVEEEDTNPASSGASTPHTDSQSINASTDSATSSFSEASTAATSFSESTATIKPAKGAISAPEGVADLLRLRTALSFICSKYLSPQLSETIKSLASSATTGTDFAPLDKHLEQLAEQRQEALAARSLGDISRKRGFEDDDDIDGRAEKKRKKDEEDKRKKAGESRGVQQLKKVNVSGMKKMSDFFKKT
ncbi:ribonuclease H2, subunit B [Amylocarpus encephaloides]|uniref:Ribonuclease H2 subunit B n=1 Tax=Amylocarpus encephaloides TaxID=45428 RepID=A0A9P8C9A7_9HELO|nr:ribonuclease H2, subunit B [Amylocarpus encephaloides]